MSFKEKLKNFVKKYHYTKEETDEAISELEESVNTIVGDIEEDMLQ